MKKSSSRICQQNTFRHEISGNRKVSTNAELDNDAVRSSFGEHDTEKETFSSQKWLWPRNWREIVLHSNWQNATYCRCHCERICLYMGKARVHVISKCFFFIIIIIWFDFVGYCLIFCLWNRNFVISFPSTTYWIYSFTLLFN